MNGDPMVISLLSQELQFRKGELEDRYHKKKTSSKNRKIEMGMKRKWKRRKSYYRRVPNKISSSTGNPQPIEAVRIEKLAVGTVMTCRLSIAAETKEGNRQQLEIRDHRSVTKSLPLDRSLIASSSRLFL